MRQRLIKLIFFVTAFILISLAGFSEGAQAARYNLYSDPADGTSIFYADTTTNSVTVTIADMAYPDEYGNISRYANTELFYKYMSDPWTYYPAQISRSGYDIYMHPVRSYISLTMMSGLIPGTQYYLTHMPSGATDLVFPYSSAAYAKYIIYTEPNPATSPYYYNITTASVNIGWTANGNGGATSYYLYRSMSPTGPWEYVSGAGIGTLHSGLVANTTYYYMVGSMVPGSTMKYSAVTSVTTAQDPAVAAAIAAKNSADASMLAAQEAKTATIDTKATVQSLQTQFTTFINADTKEPVISEFTYILPRATITASSLVTYNLVATDDKPAQLQYRYKVNNGAYSGWTALTSENINVILGDSPGIKKIVMQVKDGNSNIATKTASIFKI